MQVVLIALSGYISSRRLGFELWRTVDTLSSPEPGRLLAYSSIAPLYIPAKQSEEGLSPLMVVMYRTADHFSTAAKESEFHLRVKKVEQVDDQRHCAEN